MGGLFGVGEEGEEVGAERSLEGDGEVGLVATLVVALEDVFDDDVAAVQFGGDGVVAVRVVVYGLVAVLVNHLFVDHLVGVLHV